MVHAHMLCSVAVANRLVTCDLGWVVNVCSLAFKKQTMVHQAEISIQSSVSPVASNLAEWCVKEIAVYETFLRG